MANANPASFVMVALDKITLLQEIQVRCRVHEETVKEYTDMLNEGVDFDPVHLFVDKDDRRILSDGWHRFLSHQAAERGKIKAILHEEDPENAIQNAIEFALERNTHHGLKMSTEDKRRAVAIALKHFSKRSDRSIASTCGVSSALVTKIRAKGFTPNEPRKKKEKPEPVAPVQTQTAPQEIEPVNGHVQPRIVGNAEDNPLMERVKTLETWKREGTMEFSDARDVFATKTEIPVMVLREPPYVEMIFAEGESVSVPINQFSVKKGIPRVTADRDAVLKSLQ